MDQKHGQLAAQSEVVAPPAAAFGRPLTVAQRKALEVVRSIAASDSFVGGVAGWFPAPDLGRVAEKLGESKDEARRLADALIAKRAIIECVSCQRKIWRIATQSEGVSIRERGFGASKQRAPRRPKEAKAKAESKPAPEPPPASEPEPSPAPPLPPQAPKPEIKAIPQPKLRRPRREAKKVKLSALKADWMNPKLTLAAVAKAHDFSQPGLAALARRMGWPKKLAIRKTPRFGDAILGSRWASGESVNQLRRETGQNSQQLRQRFEALGFERPLGRIAPAKVIKPSRPDQVVRLLDSRRSNAECARELGISIDAFQKWLRRWRNRLPQVSEALAKRDAVPACRIDVTPKRLRRVLPLLKQGCSNTVIARAEGIDEGALGAWFKRWAPHSPELLMALTARRRISPNAKTRTAIRRADRIIQALQAGKDFDEMAAMEGCARETLWNWCRRWRSEIMALAEALAKAGFVQGPTRKS